VILNLVRNAVEAMNDIGMLTVETSFVHVEDPTGVQIEIPPGDYVVLSVCDTGCGISSEVSKMILEPFFSTKKTGLRRGLGLGLNVVLEIVRDHGGYIDFTNNPEHGALFTLYFPALPAPDFSDTSDETTDADAPSVLVVGLNPIQTETIRQMLRYLKFTARTISTIPSAITCLNADSFNLVILDITLDGIGDLDAYIDLITNYSSNRFLIISESTESDQIKTLVKQGATAIKRPVSLIKLSRILESLMEI